MNKVIFAFTLLLLAGCLEHSKPRSEQALEFVKTGNYELLSDEDKQVYSKLSYSKFDKSDFDVRQQPTSRFYVLEVALKDMVTYRVENEENDKVVIVTRFPELLSEFYFEEQFSEKHPKMVEKAEGLINTFNQGYLTAERLKFAEREVQVNFTSTGVFIDLKSHKIAQEKRDQIDMIVDGMSEAADKAKELNRVATIPADYFAEPDFSPLYMKAEIIAYLQECEQALADIKELDWEYGKYRVRYLDECISDYNKVLEQINKFELLPNTLAINDLEFLYISENRSELIGTYQYSGEQPIFSVSFIAHFFDKNGDEIRKQQIANFILQLEPGKSGNIKHFLNFEDMARVTKVELEPIGLW
ncbi:hypothetical protein Q4601_20710 [Shewanella sp. 1_MG-2023]|uniref:hypothetical protein n=1 Tax=unclassified Shewanella TaxID=196818 RepID=UPI0026E4916B|nr:MULTISPECIES: hypothetical protein [unclassified Shewanella]MDO6613905.1 hypothetical protein [Shewanella sp. 7_MG-2023]MDO6773199.1 hypothetical protein [Shewanella sp. 2_MG-2023]MDO6796718.1 hypothetical protein [Shewanella sp. 1_MG-2023]